MRRRSLPAFTRLEDSAGIHGLRRESRTHAQLPLLLHRREGFTRQVQAADGGIHLTIAKALLRANRHKQRAARAGSQMHRRYFSPFKLQQTAGGQRNVEGLRLIGQIAEIQRQASGISAGEEARHIQLGNNRRRHDRFSFAAAKILSGPRLGHNPQFAVKVANRQSHRPFAFLIQHHRLRLLSDNRHVINRRFAAAFEFITVAAEAQAGESPLPFDHLTIDIVNIGAVAFLAKESVPRIWRCIVGDIKYAAIDGGEQHVNLFRRLAFFDAGLNVDLQRLVGAHFIRRFQRQVQTAIFIAKRQMQQTHRPFWRRGLGFIPRTNHQGAEVEVVTIPRFIHRDR